MEFTRKNFSSGSPLEETAGYSRAISAGPFVFVGGTTSVQADGSVFGEGDGYAQTKFILEKMIKFLELAGSKTSEVIRVKMYATDMSKSKDYIRAYSEFFKPYKPLCTLVGINALNRPSQLIEIEIDALIGASIG